MKIFNLMLGIGMLLAAAGCSTLDLPRGARVVGGGLRISYTPPSDGTLILVEQTSGKVIVTESTGLQFEFNATDERDREVLKAVFGALPADARYVLYFVPDTQER